MAAVALLTVVPSGGSSRGLREGVPWFGVVGLGVGAVLAGVWVAAEWSWAGGLVGAGVVVAAWAVVTGALHLDGLADVADAAFAPVSPERRQEILHDVHHGTFGVAAVALVLVLKVAALAGAGRSGGAVLVLVAATSARAWLPFAMGGQRTLASSRMGAMPSSGTRWRAVAGFVLALAVAVLVGSWGGAVVALATAAVVLLTVEMLGRRFGGVSGDCFGAAIEAGEIAGLLVGSSLIAHGHGGLAPWWG